MILLDRPWFVCITLRGKKYMYEMGPEEECVIQFHAILHQTLQRSSKRRLQEPIRQ